MSHFYRLKTVTTTPVPLDLAGGKQTLVQCIGDSMHISTSPSFDNYVTVYSIDSGLPSGLPLLTKASDERLYFRAESTTTDIEVWVVN